MQKWPGSVSDNLKFSIYSIACFPILHDGKAHFLKLYIGHTKWIWAYNEGRTNVIINVINALLCGYIMRVDKVWFMRWGYLITQSKTYTIKWYDAMNIW